jgi:hypothetical protein
VEPGVHSGSGWQLCVGFSARERDDQIEESRYHAAISEKISVEARLQVAEY